MHTYGADQFSLRDASQSYLHYCITFLIAVFVTCMGSRGSVARAPVAKAGGPGFESQWLPWFCFCFFSLQLAY